MGFPNVLWESARCFSIGAEELDNILYYEILLQDSKKKMSLVVPRRFKGHVFKRVLFNLTVLSFIDFL